jgi:ATP-dependent Clp protease ATP-binding subunit ClpA
MSQRPARIDQRLGNAIEQATRTAARYGQRILTIEHVLRAALADPRTKMMFEDFDIDTREINDVLSEEIEDRQSRLPSIREEQVSPDTHLQQLIRQVPAVKELYGLDGSTIDIPGFLVTMLDNYRSPSTNFLFQCGLSGGDVTSHVLRHQPSAPRPKQEQQQSAPKADNSNTKQPAKKAKPKKELPDYLVDLNEMAEKGRIDAIIGRDLEIEQTVETLARRKKNNPILVGEPGVGKTAIAEGLAKRIADGDVPDSLKGKTIYSLNLGALTAGTRYRGDFEERMKELVKMMEEDEDAILFVDEIHQLMGAGKTSGAMDAANIMKPALQRGALRCIGATTYKEFRNNFEKDGAMTRRFQKIDVKEPTAAEALAILKGAVAGYEKSHGVAYSEEALKAAVDLSVKYLPQLRLPDKAFDVIDVAGAREKVKKAEDRVQEIGVAEIEKTVARMANRPDSTVGADEAEKLRTLEDELKKNVFHQDGAIRQLVTAVHTARAGLQNADKPVGSYLFTGPTGVGKTEVAKQLASQLGIELKRFDMSEYMEKHSVSRLIGAPPGYVGYDQGGLLTEAVDRTPSCIVLMDEIEKAHPDLQNILLQVMDNGALTDNNGKKVDFRNVILIMTSNVGATAKAGNGMGIGAQAPTAKDAYESAVKERFSPEFRNRLDAVVNFSELTPQAIRQVVDKFMRPVIDQAAEKGIRLELTDEVRDWLATKGYNREMGARPLGRVINEYVKAPLAPMMLFGELKDGGTAKIGFNKEAKPGESPLVIEARAAAVAPQAGRGPAPRRPALV